MFGYIDRVITTATLLGVGTLVDGWLGTTMFYSAAIILGVLFIQLIYALFVLNNKPNKYQDELDKIREELEEIR